MDSKADAGRPRKRKLREVLVFTEDETFYPSQYPWLSAVALILKGGSIDQKGYVLMELYEEVIDE